jgi:hypothetical protein
LLPEVDVLLLKLGDAALERRAGCHIPGNDRPPGSFASD